MSDVLTKYLPIAKIDEEKRIVWGLASDETIDVENEITDYEATKAAVAEWQQYANIREMHHASAVGVAEEIILDDDNRSLWLGVKIVDDEAWRKVKEGVYKGFSIGGKALQKVSEVINNRLIRRITKYLLIEISLVDRPANPSARFSLIKRQEGGMDMTKQTEETPLVDGQKSKPTELPEPVAKAAAADEDIAKMDGQDEDEEVAGEPNETAKAEGEIDETPPAEEEPPLTEETVKEMMLAMLQELGLIREEGAEFAQAAQIVDLRKSMEQLAPTEDLQKISGNVSKLVGDMAKVATALDEFEQRLERVEQLPQGTGPVLRELTFGAVQDQTETVLKSLLADATDPQMREVIGQRLTQLQIKQAHQQRQGN